MTPSAETRVVDSYELSPTQEGMLFHGLFGQETGVDLEQIVTTIRGPFDEAAFIAAFHEVASRHSILRTRFRHDDGDRPVQQVVERVEIPVERLELAQVDPPTRSARFEAALRLDRGRGIDIGRAPAMRLTMVDWDVDEHRVIWTFHHALLDGRSFPIVLREVFASYDAILASSALDLPSRRPYREYIEFLRGIDLVAAETFWRDYLSGFAAPTPLVVDHAETADEQQTAIQGVVEQRLTQHATTALRDLAATRGVTLNTLLQTAWALVLHRYSGEEDVVFGATRACRRSAFPDADEMVGLFINTLPIRVHVDPNARLDDLLREVRAQQVALREHEHTPLVRVQSWSDVRRGSPLFETIVVYDASTLDEQLRDLKADDSSLAFTYHGQTNYPISLVAYGDDEMLIRLENDRRRVDDATASRMLGHVVTVLGALPTYAEREVHELPLLTDEERTALEVEAATVTSFPPDRCLHERFEERVRQDPDKVAAVCEGESLSYGELDRRANALALELHALGVGRGALVGLRCERSLHLPVAILGILKAGAGYLPLDPAYPRERVEFMLADAGVAVVVSERAFAADVEQGAHAIVLLDEERAEAERGPVTEVTPADLAYVMYTSGSTGKPKGVRVTHYNVTRLFDATAEWFEFTADDVWTLFHSYAFDFSVWELWGALLHGGRLVVVPYWVSREPEAFRELVLREGVSVLNQTPSAFRQLTQADVQAGPPAKTDLRYVIFGGEALELQGLRPWFERHGDVLPRLVNMYGITETTVHVTYRPISLADVEAGAGSVIGVPIPDLRVVLCDPQGALVPIGVAGELYVGGAGVAHGYLARPELTAQRFLPDPFASDGEATMYRSGDLARRLDTGELEYLGRIDEQVKVRGFRIELGEVEAALAGHPAVGECVVVANGEGSDKRLVAYVVGEGETLVEELRAHLRTTLPEYMVPAHFVSLETLPLTANGKVDRKALPAPELGRLEQGTPYVAAQTPTQKAIADIWAAVLHAPRVGIDDNFFELGGDSILTIQVIARCRQAGLQFTPRDLALAPTIAELSARIEVTAPPTPADQPEPEANDGPVMPTPIQSWFFEQRFADPNHWNQAFLFEIPAAINLDALQKALSYVVSQHDAFRLRVTTDDRESPLTGDPLSAGPSVTRIDLAKVSPHEHPAVIESASRTAQSGLNLEVGPLVAAVHFDRGEHSGRLLLAAHHLAVDGVSWRVLIEDLEAAYSAFEANATPEPPVRSASYRRWSEAIRQYAATEEVAGSLPRWLEIVSERGELDVSDAQPAAGREELARSVTVSLDEEGTDALLHRVRAAYRTEINDVLLTALALALRARTGRDTNRVDVEGHGREEWIDTLDLSRTVGWFTTLYPVVLDLEGAEDEGSALKRVKEGLRRVPDRGLSYGALRYASDDHEVRARLANHSPSELLFNYLGQFDHVVAGSKLFRFANEPTGAWHGPANQRTHRLEVVAAVRDGRFEARWIYSPERDRQDVVERLAESFATALRDLIEHCVAAPALGYTPSDFPLARLEQDELDRIAARHPRIEDLYPLSPMQRLFLSMEAGTANLGFEQWVFRLTGPVDPVALRNAWEWTITRHSMLRTAFVTDGVAEPLQVVEERVSVPWSEEDWTAEKPAVEGNSLESFLQTDRERGFDVGVAPLHRVTLIRRSEDEYMLVWSTHHLYVDGWSWPLIFRDVGDAYEALLAGKSPRRRLPLQYGSYIDWLAGAAPDSREFWKEALSSFVSPTPLPYAPTMGGSSGGEVSARLDPSTTSALRSLARSLRVTLNTLVQGSWAVLLGHLSKQDEVVFGAAFSGRPAELPDIETLVGPCVNNLPVPVRLDPAMAVSAWLSTLHERSQEIAQHQYASLEDIQQWAGVPWRLRLFDSLVVFQNYRSNSQELRWGDVEIETLALPESTNYPLTLNVTPNAEIELKVSGSPGRFAPTTPAMILEGVMTILRGFAERPEASLADIQSLLPQSTHGAARDAATTFARRPPAKYAAPGNEIERLVADVWQDLFEVENVGMDENFFDLGGHSILLLQAHARLRERLGREVSVVALLQYPTIRSLARYLGNEDVSSAELDAVRDRAKRQRQALARQRGLQGSR